MRDDFFFEQAREAMKRWAARPDEEQWEILVKRGIIDEKGNVLIRMPEPPKKPKPARKKTKKRSSDSGGASNGDEG